MGSLLLGKSHGESLIDFIRIKTRILGCYAGSNYINLAIFPQLARVVTPHETDAFDLP